MHCSPPLSLSHFVNITQIENEFGPQVKLLGPAGHEYMTWAANMAVGLGTGVPWVMYKEEDAPDPVYHGRTNFGRSAGGPFVTTSYD
ncbi:Beta-galactosidase [Bertholletia excelsa]